MTSPSGSKAESGRASLASGSWAPPGASASAGSTPRVGWASCPQAAARRRRSSLRRASVVASLPAASWCSWASSSSRAAARLGGGRDPVHEQRKELLLAGQFRRQASRLLALRVLLLASRGVNPEQLAEQGRVCNQCCGAGPQAWGSGGSCRSGKSPSSQPRAAASQLRPAPPESVNGDCPGAGARASSPRERSSRAASRATRAAAVTSWMPCQTP